MKVLQLVGESVQLWAVKMVAYSAAHWVDCWVASSELMRVVH